MPRGAGFLRCGVHAAWDSVWSGLVFVRLGFLTCQCAIVAAPMRKTIALTS